MYAVCGNVGMLGTTTAIIVIERQRMNSELISSVFNFKEIAIYNTIEEARACAQAIAAFENVPPIDYTII